MADALTRPTPLDLATPTAYDRNRWESAVLAGDFLYMARMVGLLLAHLAGPRGELPAGGAHHADRLADLGGLPRKQVRISLNVLERQGFISRPDIHAWEPRDVLRPITLTLPTDAFLHGVRREPPHPGRLR